MESVAPDQILWREAAKQGGLFETVVVAEPAGTSEAGADFRVPRAFVDVAGAAARHTDPERWRLLYSVLWKIARGGAADALASESDPDVVRLKRLAKHVSDADLAARTPGAGEFVPKDELQRCEQILERALIRFCG